MVEGNGREGREMGVKGSHRKETYWRGREEMVVMKGGKGREASRRKMAVKGGHRKETDNGEEGKE